MNNKLNEIKSLLKEGDHAKAEDALKSYRNQFPDDWDGKLMGGLIAKLQRDEKTFLRIYNKAQEALDYRFGSTEAMHVKNSPLWKKYQTIAGKYSSISAIKYVIIGVLIAAVAVGIVVKIKNPIHNTISDMDLYVSPEYFEKQTSTPSDD